MKLARLVKADIHQVYLEQIGMTDEQWVRAKALNLCGSYDGHNSSEWELSIFNSISVFNLVISSDEDLNAKPDGSTKAVGLQDLASVDGIAEENPRVSVQMKAAIMEMVEAEAEPEAEAEQAVELQVAEVTVGGCGEEASGRNPKSVDNSSDMDLECAIDNMERRYGSPSDNMQIVDELTNHIYYSG
jgi:hypothetical protein